MSILASFLSRMSVPHIAVAAEPIPEFIDVDGKKRPTKNSDGRFIYPTLSGIENFWRWFGDSKVVDTEGKPRVMFHSTGADFSKFKRGSRDPGIHFGTVEQADERAARGDVPGNASMMPVYLKITNPMRLQDQGTWDSGTFGYDAGRKLQQSGHITADTRWNIRNIVRAMKSAGHDGIVYKNEYEVPGMRELAAQFNELSFTDYSRKKDELRQQGHDSYMVFNATQIKSATGNNGKFAPRSASITASFEATAVSKKDKLKAQQKAAQSAPQTAAPAQPGPRLILTDERVFNVDGLLPDVAEYIKVIQEYLAQRKSADFIRSQQIPFRGATKAPQYNILSVRDDLKGCEYLKFADAKARKHWRVYFAVSNTAVQILDIFDKDDNAITKQEIARLTQRMSRFRQLAK